MSGSGFQVDTARWRGAATGFQQASDRVAGARGTVSAPSVPMEAFGISGPGPQIAEKLRTRVENRLAALADRVERLGEHASKLNRGADEYDRVEQENTADITAAGGQDGQGGERP